MKNGKKPTRQQKDLMKMSGYVPESWLVVKDLPNCMEIVNRNDLKKVETKKIRTRKILKY